MNTIVMNTMTGAVSEYSAFDFQSITPTHAGSATGLFLLGGALDIDAPISARIQTGKIHWGTSLKKFLKKIFFGLKGEGTFTAHVGGENDDYEYDFPAIETGESRAQPGRGIRETYLSFGLSNTDGQEFQLDNIEVEETTSTTRRV